MCVFMGTFSVMDTEVTDPLSDEVMTAESCVAFSGNAGSQRSEVMELVARFSLERHNVLFY